jgi:UDP:flavonoid glycosyltransferase YjiC (YdhE family)
VRVLISACPLYGHVNTLLPLARAAQRAGHQVRFATGPDLAGQIERGGVASLAVGPPAPAASDRADLGVAWFVESARARARALVPIAERWAPDLVVHDETELAGAVAARVTGARHAVHGLGLRPPTRIWQALAPALDTLGREHAVVGTADAARAATYLHVCPPSLQPRQEPIWADEQPLRPSPGRAVAGDVDPVSLVARLPFRDTVHLTLGTVFNHDASVLRAALAGLADLPVNVVVATGPDGDPERLGPQPPQVLVAPYLPHASLLPLCRLVVSQGGAGVMFGALHHGLPQLMMPQGADQFMNAAAAVQAGAALQLGTGEVSPAAVRSAVQRLLVEPSFSAAARQVQEELAAMPDEDAVIELLTRPRREVRSA